jgi:hypothetical protein
MRFALITPCEIGPDTNPGSHLLTAGVRWLLRAARPDAAFVSVSMLGDRAEHWRAAAACDCVVVCGNPRFSMSTGVEFWEGALWDRLVDLRRAGVRVIDGWAGSAFPYSDLAPSVDEMAGAIAAFPGRRHRLQQAAEIPHHITRDPTMQRIYETAGIPSTLLPCSSWWAADELGIESVERHCDAVLLYQFQGHAWLPDVLAGVVERMRSDLPVRFIAPTLGDFEWAVGCGLKPELVSDGASLLRLFARARRVLSFRVHCAIPAARMGAEVALVAIDSRSDTVGVFGLPVVRFTDLSEWTPTFAPGLAPDTSAVVKTIEAMLCDTSTEG